MNNLGKLTYRHVREVLAVNQSTVCSTLSDQSVGEKLEIAEQAYRIWKQEVVNLVAEYKRLGSELQSFQYQLTAFEVRVTK